MKKIIYIILFSFVCLNGYSQPTIKGPASVAQKRDITGGSGTPANAFIDITKAPYLIGAGGNASLAVEQAMDSLYNYWGGGTVLIPIDVTWGRPHAGTQKGALLRPNITVDFLGNTASLIGNCSLFSSDFGSDSLGFTITADVDSLTTNFTVTSSTGAAVGDTVFYRLQTAAYDAFEPRYFGYRLISAVPDGTHITLNGPTGGNMTVASTTSLNRRIIRIHKLATNIIIRNLNYYNDGNVGAGHVPESGISIQGGWNILVTGMSATNPGAGIVGFQFGYNCRLENSYLYMSANNGNANHGRGASIVECDQCVIKNTTFNAYQQTAVVNEAYNPNFTIDNCTFNNNYNDSVRIALTSLGSGNMTMTNCRFKGYKHALYNAVLPSGVMEIGKISIDRGTPFVYYEGAGILTTDWLQFGYDTSFYQRKTYTKKVLLLPNTVVGFDSLPKGRMVKATIKVDDTTGIRAFLFRRDASGNNNGTDMRSQFRSGRAIVLNTTNELQLGIGLSSTNLNYNDDKSYIYQTDATLPANDYMTITVEYLEKYGATLNNANGTTFDIVNPNSFSNGLTNTAGSVVLGGSPLTANTSIAGGNFQLNLGLPGGGSNPLGDVSVTSASFNVDVSTKIYLGGGLAIGKWNTITSGSSSTANASTSNIVFNPASAITSYNLTLPATAGITDGYMVIIHAGGTITSGAVVTTFTLTANTGQTIIQSSAPITIAAGDCLVYKYKFINGTADFWYREK